MKRSILNQEEITRAISRIASQIIEKNKGAEGLVLVGISERGTQLAISIAQKIKEIENKAIDIGTVNIKLYNEDNSANEDPVVSGKEINTNVNGKTVVIVDDIVITGRTIHTAINEIYDIGHPKYVKVAALIDNMNNRKLPITCNFTGRIVETSKDEIIDVQSHAVTIKDREKSILM